MVDALKWNSETVGNIEVRYADGRRDRWTTKGSCGHEGFMGFLQHGPFPSRISCQ